MVAFLRQHDAPFELRTSRSSSHGSKNLPSRAIAATTCTSTRFGSQGPVLLQTLNILEQFDLRAMKHNSADYLHTVVESLKLAYADRDTYYADPAFVQVPGGRAAVEGVRAVSARS